MISTTTLEQMNPELPGIIVLSHGPLASGLLGSLALICGDVENIASFQLEEGDDPDAFRKAFGNCYEQMPNQSLFLIDVFGGTPCNEVIKYFLETGQTIRAVCGVNLGLLMEACQSRYQEIDFLDNLVHIGQECIVHVGDAWAQQVHD